jgi:hypothetical protein
MERLVALMCWLFDGEQHLDRSKIKSKRET